MAGMTRSDMTSNLTGLLDRQRAAFLRDGPPSLQQRKRDLNKLKAAILEREEAFVKALNTDFGHRSREETMLFDVGSTVGVSFDPGNACFFDASGSTVVHRAPTQQGRAA